MKIGNKLFTDTSVVGILNLTPDSFSDGGEVSGISAAKRRVGRMLAEGAGIIELGGESTRPDYVQVSLQEELNRVIPILTELVTTYDVPYSIDTNKPEVASRAVLAGADMINCVSYNDDVAAVAAQARVPLVLVHNRDLTTSKDFLTELTDDLKRLVDRAVSAGVAADMLIIDGGIGFGKTAEQCFETVAHTAELKKLGAVMVAASRKSFIGKALNAEVHDRLNGTLAVSAIATMQGCDFVRVHDVKANVEAIKIARAVRDRL